MKVIKIIAMMFLAVTLTTNCTKEDQNQEEEKEKTETEKPGENKPDDEEEKPGGNENPEEVDPEVPEIPGKEEEKPGENENPEEVGPGNPKDPEVPVTGQAITGKISVFNNSMELGVADKATVELFKNGKKVASTTSNNTGKYTFSNIAEGTYTIKVFKKGHYNKAVKTPEIVKYKVTKDKPLTADIKIYIKATASIEAISWRQGSTAKGDSNNGVLLDITFKNLDLSKVVGKYVYIYFLAGYNDQISKANAVEKLDQANGNGWTLGYAIAWIRKDEIKNNQVKGYWDSRFCGWMGGTLKSAKRPSHIAIYVTNAFTAGVDGLFGDMYDAIGDDYSGISDHRFLK